LSDIILRLPAAPLLLFDATNIRPLLYVVYIFILFLLFGIGLNKRKRHIYSMLYTTYIVCYTLHYLEPLQIIYIYYIYFVVMFGCAIFVSTKRDKH
jgi:hypothetical protein